MIFVQFLQILQDKILAKEYFRILGLHSPEIFRRVADCQHLPLIEELPQSYVFKSTHLSGCVTVVQDGKVLQAKACPMCNANRSLFYPVYNGPRPKVGMTVTQRHLQAACEAWTNTEYKGQFYLGISPRVFFEKQLPLTFIEIKCMVFHGRTDYFYIASETAHTMFARNGSIVPVYHFIELGLKIDFTLQDQISKPHFEKILKTCDTAGAGFDHMRIDIYTDLKTEQIMMGEVTAYPFGGVTNWSPNWFAQHLATDLWGCIPNMTSTTKIWG